MTGRYRDLVSVKAQAAWRGLRVRVAETSPGRFENPPSPDIRLLMHLGEPSDLECEIDGKTQRHLQVRGDITLIPAGATVNWVDHDDTSTMSLFLSHRLIAGAAEDLGVAPMRWALPPIHKLRDPHLFKLGLLLKSVAESEDDYDSVFIDTLANSVAVRTLGEYGLRRKAPSPEIDSKSRVQAVLEFIDANLGGDLPLETLAAQAAMSVSHFRQAFRQITGRPVHQYVIERRTLKARAMLESGCGPISQVALETGFCHQSHMAKYMQRLFGVTPSALVAQT